MLIIGSPFGTIGEGVSKKVCFIGHRKIRNPNIKEELKTAIQNEINNGCRFFVMGSHGEFDNLALYVLKEFRKMYKDIRIEVAITSFNQIKKRLVHDDIFGKEYEIPFEDVETIMYSIEEVHFKRKIVESNRQMISHCDTVICYVDEKQIPSGAKLALNYAKQKGIKIINLFKNKN